MLNKRKLWNSLGLSAMGIWLVWELIGAFDKDPETLPFTQFFIFNVPQPVGIFIITAFSGWLVGHFIKYYRKLKK